MALLLQEGLVCGVLEQPPHEIGHACHQVADRRVDERTRNRERASASSKDRRGPAMSSTGSAYCSMIAICCWSKIRAVNV